MDDIDTEPCGDFEPLFGLMQCTLDKGHEDDHEAWGMTRVISSWGQVHACEGVAR